MPFLAAYAAFWGIATPLMGGIAICGSPTLYWAFYWPLEGIGYVLSAMLALSLVLSVTHNPSRRLDLQALIGVVFVLPFAVALGAGSWHPWLGAAKWADIAVMWLLLGSMTLRDWKQPEEGLAWGLIVGMSGHVLCALIQDNHDPKEWLRMAYQLAGIMQLAIWLCVLSPKRRTSFVGADGL